MVKSQKNIEIYFCHYCPCVIDSFVFFRANSLSLTSSCMSSTMVRQDHQWSSSVVFFQGKSFQQHREAMKKTITDRNQEYKGELDYICLKLTHFLPEKHLYRDTNFELSSPLKHLDVAVDLISLVSLIIDLLSSGKLWCAKKSKKQRKKLLFNPSKNIGEYLLNS